MRLNINIVLSSIILLFLNIHSIYGQNTVSKTPLYIFLQKYADSTVVMRVENTGSRMPDLQILSKKGDTVSLYRYKDVRQYSPLGIIPKLIRDSLYKNNRMAILNTPIEVNIYFNAIYSAQDTLRNFWKNLTSLNTWNLKDDFQDGEGCPMVKGKNRKNIYDGGSISLYLITRKEIKRIYFYAPYYYEQECPGRRGRQAIIQLAKLFGSFFK